MIPYSGCKEGDKNNFEYSSTTQRWKITSVNLLIFYLLKAFFKSAIATAWAAFASGTTAAIPKNSCVTPS